MFLFHIDGLVQDCSNSIANALELLQSCTEPSMWSSYVETLVNQVNLQSVNDTTINSSQGAANRGYRKISNISRTESQNLHESHLVWHLSLPNLLKPGVK